jgi:hypothetical protein
LHGDLTKTKTEECTISYGHLSNASLLRLYGFTIENPSSSPSAGSSASSSSSSRTSSSSSSSSASSSSSSSALSSAAFSSAASLLSGSAPLNLNIEELAAATTTTTTVSNIDSVVSNVTTTNTINTSNSPTAAEAEATQGQQQQQQQQQQLDAFCEAAAALNPSDLLLPSLQSPMPSKRLYDLALAAAKADLIPHNPTLGRGGGRGGGGGGDLREMGDESVEDFEGNVCAAAGSNKHDMEGSSTAAAAAAAAAANAWLLGGVDSQLASYETSLLEDEALLLLADDTACRQKAEGGSKKTGRLPLWQRHCVVVRSGEKRVLHAGREALLVELSK